MGKCGRLRFPLEDRFDRNAQSFVYANGPNPEMNFFVMETSYMRLMALPAVLLRELIVSGAPWGRYEVSRSKCQSCLGPMRISSAILCHSSSREIADDWPTGLHPAHVVWLARRNPDDRSKMDGWSMGQNTFGSTRDAFRVRDNQCRRPGCWILAHGTGRI